MKRGAMLHVDGLAEGNETSVVGLEHGARTAAEDNKHTDRDRGGDSQS